MKIAILDPEVDISLIQKYLHPSHTLFAYQEKHDTGDIDAIMIRSQTVVDKNLLDHYPNLKTIFRVGVGLEKVDVEICKQRNIEIINTPGANSDAVAELAIGALLEISRGICGCIHDLKHHILQPRSHYIGKELSTQNIGFIGFGTIGKAIAKRLQGFDIKQGWYYDPYVDGIFYGAQKEENKNILFERCDIIIIVAPLFPETKHTINEKTLKLCKDDVKILNLSRGGLVDEKALLHFLIQHPQAGFFADVWKGEPKITDTLQKLLDLPHVLITNHIGSATSSAIEKMHYFKELE